MHLVPELALRLANFILFDRSAKCQMLVMYQFARSGHYGWAGGFVNRIDPSGFFQWGCMPSHHDFAGINDLNSDLSVGTLSTDP